MFGEERERASPELGQTPEKCTALNEEFTPAATALGDKASAGRDAALEDAGIVKCLHHDRGWFRVTRPHVGQWVPCSVCETVDKPTCPVPSTPVQSSTAGLGAIRAVAVAHGTGYWKKSKNFVQGTLHEVHLVADSALASGDGC